MRRIILKLFRRLFRRRKNLYLVTCELESENPLAFPHKFAEAVARVHQQPPAK